MNYFQAQELVATVLIVRQESGIQIQNAKKEKISLIMVQIVGSKNRWVQLFKPK
jgi:hypothetical protein